MRRFVEALVRRAAGNTRAERLLSRRYRMLSWALGRGYDSAWRWASPDANDNDDSEYSNDFRNFFDQHKTGHGIWKWYHYFGAYDRHLQKFRNKEVHLLEIGIYSGGSLEMWRNYFGAEAHLYGVDIEPACSAYEADNIKIFIGDQNDRLFWQDFRRKVPVLDVVIDDGGHQFEQQVTSLEELLPLLRPGGVYICEDVHGSFNPFASYVHGLCHKLNEFNSQDFPDDNDRRIVCPCTPFQSAIGSIHLYPFMTVIEKNPSQISEFRAPKHGTQWQPFFK